MRRQSRPPTMKRLLLMHRPVIFRFFSSSCTAEAPRGLNSAPLHRLRRHVGCLGGRLFLLAYRPVVLTDCMRGTHLEPCRLHLCQP